MSEAVLEPSEKAIVDIETWRGRAINHFGRVDLAIGEALVSAKLKAPTLKVSNNPAQRRSLLMRIAEQSSASDKLKSQLLDVMDRWAAHERLRNFLVHGKLRHAIEKSAKWVAVFEMCFFDASAEPIVRYTVFQTESASRLNQLSEDADQVAKKIGNMKTYL